ncbi:response regulator transcription factor [Deinococcus arenicola]|uniref:Response regulator transcription factor n=1 Tax=Deinococcus arenicola TaxID=2994950 RepID=A0ABU4DUQ7_9DEIO|nr:response regulator transcription factor [Deinococcus sp. ZS9-10]MDV6376178.1 response regulator transcription factor [Deinococcus sp. ZS9-10]
MDDQTLVRLGLRRLLELAPDIQVIAEAADGQAAVTMVQEVRPDLLLLDVRMPHLDGPGVLEALGVLGCLPPTVILTTFNDDTALLRCLRAGARGSLLKDVSYEELIASVRHVAQGGSLNGPLVPQHLLERLRHPISNPPPEDEVKLTEREIDILRLMSGGYSNKELADALSLKEGTVKNHVSNILLKLEARDRTRAVLRALELGLL